MVHMNLYFAEMTNLVPIPIPIPSFSMLHTGNGHGNEARQTCIFAVYLIKLFSCLIQQLTIENCSKMS